VKLTLLTNPVQITASGWSEFVMRHPEGSIFQSPDMYDFFRAVPRFDPEVIGVGSDSGQLIGILLAVTIREMKGPLSFFSARTVVYGGPLIADDVENRNEIAGMLLKGLKQAVSGRSIFIQFRNFFSMEPLSVVFEEKGFHLRDRLNRIVDTSDRERMIRNMSESRWRQIRKGLGIQSAVGSRQSAVSSQQSGVGSQIMEPGTRNPEPETRNPEPGILTHARIIVPSDISQVREFYDILFHLYRYKIKKPLPPWEFFEQFYIFSREGKLGAILLVEYKGKIIGGILSPVTPGKTIYEWYVCGLDQEYREVHPSVLATWAAMDHACEHSIPKFDFMGLGIPNRDYGVREFKSRFGGEMVNYGRFAMVNNRFFYFIAETGYNFLSLFRKI
jgi:hypothetical protein